MTPKVVTLWMVPELLLNSRTQTTAPGHVERRLHPRGAPGPQAAAARQVRDQPAGADHYNLLGTPMTAPGPSSPRCPALRSSVTSSSPTTISNISFPGSAAGLRLLNFFMYDPTKREPPADECLPVLNFKEAPLPNDPS